jgi:hypothetical protein
VDADNGCSGRLRTRKDRLGDFFEFVFEVGEVGEVVVLPEVGKFFEVVGAGQTGFVQLQLLC